MGNRGNTQPSCAQRGRRGPMHPRPDYERAEPALHQSQLRRRKRHRGVFRPCYRPAVQCCAAHPLGTPSAVVARPATQWTFAHEIGRVLDLIHVNNNDLLMTGNGTTNITNPPPELVASEVATMQATVLTVDVNNDDHILAKLQTQGNSGFMRCSQQMVPGVSNWPELRGRRSAAS